MMKWEAALDSMGGYRIGLDIGSRSTKLAFLRNGREVMAVTDTFSLFYDRGGIDIPEGVEIVTTGYGRDLVPGSLKISEIRAHVVGAVRGIDLDDFTLLDIGGQDFKVTRVENGGIRDFFMNDKCAAGTGRFLEKMAEMLEMDISKLGGFKGDYRILESTCTVFTETEIISKMSEGRSKEELAGGIIHSVYERIEPLLKRFPLDVIVFTGGVSKCDGLADTLRDKLGCEVRIPSNAQYMGSLGCLYVKQIRDSKGVDS